MPSFHILTIDDDPALQLVYARSLVAAAAALPRHDFTDHRPSTDGRIRIGFFSANFHEHPAMLLTLGMFERLDRRRFEVHAFSFGPDKQDDMRRRLTAAFDHFHDISGLDNAQAATFAREKGIDIAVDMMGLTEQARVGIFAYGAAPRQLNFLGFPGTMGADFIDHIIADRIVAPPEDQAHFAEKLAYLPHCYFPNDRGREIAPRRFTRAELGLPEPGFVFCCFNNSYKITPAEYDIWMRLLDRVEGSVLWLLEDNRWAADNLRREALARGVDPARLVFAPRIAPAEHLARHDCADLFLDTFKVNAHTTACDALWTGVPVVTRMGSSMVARVAGSLLHALDLPELVTDSAQAYEDLALALATDPAALAAVRAKLAENRLTKPLFDTELYTRDMERLCERIHAGAE